jgi:hypothetical protein
MPSAHRTTRPLLWLGLAAWLGLSPAAARAQEAAPSSPPASPPASPNASPSASPQRAASIARAVEEGLAREFPPGRPGLRLAWDGPVQVVPAGERYELRVPGAALVGAGGGRLVLGTVRVDLAPGPGDTWAYSVSLPERAQGLDAQGRPAVEARVAARSVSGVWSAGLGRSLSMDASLGGIEVVPVGAPAGDRQALGLRRLSVSQRLEETAPGRWRWPFELSAEGLRYADSAGRPAAAVDRLSASAATSGVDLARHAAFEEAVRGAEALFEAGDPDAPPTPAEWEAIARLVEQARDLFEEATSEFRAGGLAFRLEDGTSVRAAGLVVATRLAGLRSGRGAVSQRLALEGLEAAPLPPEIAPFLPRDAEIALSADGLPNAALWDALARLARDGRAGDPAAADRFGEAIAAALGAAGTEFRVDGGNLSSPALGAALSGLVRAAPGAALGLVGEADLVLRGLDAALAALAPPPGARPDADAQEFLGMLALLQALGQSGTDSQGRPLRRYAFRLGEDGRPLLNGADMAPLLGLGDPSAPPLPAPRAPVR